MRVHILYDLVFGYMVISLRCGNRRTCNIGNLLVVQFIVIAQVERYLLFGRERQYGVLQFDRLQIALVHIRVGHHSSDTGIFTVQR